jgi:uncharacterized RDD family membrane protein YckC
MSKARSKKGLFSTGMLNVEPDSMQGYYAGFTSRAVALIIDMAIITVISAGVIGAMSLFFDLPSIKRFILWLNSLLPGISQIFVWLTGPRFAALFYILFSYLYFVFFFATTGQTVGKAIMGLRVVTTDGKRMGVKRSFIRAVCYTLSLAPLGLGFLWVLGEDRRKAWHDKIARTYVLYVWEARYEENFLRNAVYQLTKKRAEKQDKKNASAVTK